MERNQIIRDRYIEKNISYSEESPSGILDKGKAVGYKDARGYFRVYVGDNVMLAHRLVWYLHHGEFPKDSELNINKTIRENFNLMRINNNNEWPSFFYYRENKYILKIFKK